MLNKIDYHLGPYEHAIEAHLNILRNNKIIERIWNYDHTVWKSDADEITNRLGWLRIATEMESQVSQLENYALELLRSGIKRVLLLGMGGSSLAPELISKIFGKDSEVALAILDSTDPATIQDWDNKLDYSQTLFIVATKSGGTVETLSFFKFFYIQALHHLEQEAVGKHFIAITDPGSKLEKMAAEYEFGRVFLNNPNIGGRYSALSYFGLVPAALVGVDLSILLGRVTHIMNQCQIWKNNPAAKLGTTIAQLALADRDKATFITSKEISGFGDWVEQLIAESTGKEGQGILPVVGEPLGDETVYGFDRFFVHLKLAGDSTHTNLIKKLIAAGHPVIELELMDVYDLGSQFFLWELATAVAGYWLGINPFDQPNVESAKVLARKLMAEYQSLGTIPEIQPTSIGDGYEIYSSSIAASLDEALNKLLDQSYPGDYVSLQAYLPPTMENETLLHQIRQEILWKTHLATTLGFGPRFLHSTGQLHKGDGGNGLFIQITVVDLVELIIPNLSREANSNVSFSILKQTQALGDYTALIERGRRVLRIHLTDDLLGGLHKILAALG